MRNILLYYLLAFLSFNSCAKQTKNDTNKKSINEVTAKDAIKKENDLI